MTEDWLNPYFTEDGFSFVEYIVTCDSLRALEEFRDVEPLKWIFSWATAELIVSIAGQPRYELPSEVDDWVRANVGEGDVDLSLAKEIVDELSLIDIASLWARPAKWERALGDLRNRLHAVGG